MKFCTAITCMDGRIQLPVISYLQKRFNVEYVDLITEAGANLVLAKRDDSNMIESVRKKLKISVEKHGSVAVAVIGHYDCAGNPSTKEEQIHHIKESINFIKEEYNNIKLIGLWVDENWKVNEL